MDPLDLARINLLTPPVLAFVLGALAVAVRSDLRIPDDLSASLSLYLLFAIGLKGGHELRAAPPSAIAGPLVATVVLSVAVPILAFAAFRLIGRFDPANAGALAAHYGSVSAVTFSAALAFMAALQVPVEPFMAALVVFLESPAIVLGVVLARLGTGGVGPLGALARELLAGKSVVLLAGGLLIGALSEPAGYGRVAPLVELLFPGALMLFLLDLGIAAARRARDLRTHGPRLAGLAIVLPVVNGAIGSVLGAAAGLGVGGTTVLGVLAASASYIAAPAAVRTSIPAASPGVYLTASLGITFPFNLAVGIPLCYAFAQAAHAALRGA